MLPPSKEPFHKAHALYLIRQACQRSGYIDVAWGVDSYFERLVNQETIVGLLSDALQTLHRSVLVRHACKSTVGFLTAS